MGRLGWPRPATGRVRAARGCSAGPGRVRIARGCCAGRSARPYGRPAPRARGCAAGRPGGG
eukprot:6785258-Alexandrium_andersonii.AAC.1